MNNFFIIFPCLRYPDVSELGGIEIKSTVNDFEKESKEVKDELMRIASFFTQVGAQQLDSFSYIYFEAETEEINDLLSDIKRDLEIYRFIAFDPSGKGLDYEHTVPYVCIPHKSNPYEYKKDEKIFSYDISLNFEQKNYHQAFSTAREQRPFFNLNVYADSPPSIDEKEYSILRKGVTETSLRSLSWYNKVYLKNLPDGSENLLRISTAFETLLEIDREAGRKFRMDELVLELDKEGAEILTEDQKKIIDKYLQEKLTYQYAEEVLRITGSESIKRWFKKYFYPVGSTIRHGDRVGTEPIPRESVNRDEFDRSLYFGERASHHFLNNVYFGKKLFKLVFRELHFPASEFLKGLETRYLEKLLVSDEERLKQLEKSVLETKEGDLDWKVLEACFDLGGSFSGDKKRIYVLLQRLLNEISVSFPEIWKQIEKDAKIIIETNVGEVPLDIRKDFDRCYSSVIEIDSKLHDLDIKYSQEEDFKLFHIKNFVSYALHRLL
jgi:hypothetical protein